MNLKLILFYLIGFIILYLEAIPVAGMSFGSLWKIVLIFVLFIPIIYATLKKKYMEMFAFITILFAFKTLISYSSLDYIINTITIFTKTLMLPMLYLFFILKLKEETLKYLAKHFAILIILSFIPYILGFLSPMGEGYDLAPFGLNGQYGLVGTFLNPHSASISIAFSMIVVTAQINKNNTNKENLFYILLLLLGFYELIDTYVRTGIMVYLVSLIFLYLQNINLKKVLLLIITAITLSAGSFYLIQTNEVAQMRFQDKNKYMKKSELGSGRFLFWQTAVENWLDDDSSVIFIGLGQEYAKDKMLEDVGLRIFAHNEFFQTLQQEGLIGFILFISSLILIYSFIRKNKNSHYYLSAISLFIGMLIMMMFQGGFYFNVVFFLSIYLALLKNDYLKEIKKRKTEVRSNAKN
jgi:hypothetical protein